MAFSDEHIWIIGASSGIGEALARELDAQGATLILSSRRKEALSALNKSLAGEHHVISLDVSDANAVKTVTKQIAQSVTRLDRVIFMAAIYNPNNTNESDMAFVKQLVEINLSGAIYTTYACLPVFEKQQQGQLVFCGSVAGYTGLPRGQPYSATKAAIINFAESLYVETPKYIDIKVINPGFVRTRMTDMNDFPMPMRVEPDQAAKAIAKGLHKNAFEIHFPRRFTYLLKLIGSLPYWILFAITKRLNK